MDPIGVMLLVFLFLITPLAALRRTDTHLTPIFPPLWIT